MENKKYTELLDEELNAVNGGVVARKEEFAARGANGVIMITSDQSKNEFNEVDRKIKLNPKDRFTTRVRNVLGRFTGTAISSYVKLAKVVEFDEKMEGK